jgi:hypothetical protein
MTNEKKRCEDRRKEVRLVRREERITTPREGACARAWERWQRWREDMEWWQSRRYVYCNNIYLIIR